MSKGVIYQVPESIKKEALLNNEDYKSLYENSINDPETFWSTQATSYLEWISKWKNISEYTRRSGKSFRHLYCQERYMDSLCNCNKSRSDRTFH